MFSANFKLSCQGDGIIFHADTDQECRAWVSDMKEVINVMVEHRKTLRKESSRKRPVKKRQLKYFEAEYILSPAQKGNKYVSKDKSICFRLVSEVIFCTKFFFTGL